MGYGDIEQAKQACVGEARPLGVMEQLNMKRERLVKEMEEVAATIAMFEKHPEFEQCLTQLSRVGIYR